MKKIIEFDQQLLVYLNNLGSTPFDDFWLLITNQFSWIPFFILLAYFLKKIFNWKELGFIALAITLLIIFCDQSTNFFKYSFERIRPCNDPILLNQIRILKCSPTFSFFSAHASNSMACMTFLFLTLKKHYNFIALIFIYPLLFAYSRIYIGMHYPLDIFFGYIFGAFSGLLFFYLYKKNINLLHSSNR